MGLENITQGEILDMTPKELVGLGLKKYDPAILAKQNRAEFVSYDGYVKDLVGIPIDMNEEYSLVEREILKDGGRGDVFMRANVSLAGIYVAMQGSQNFHEDPLKDSGSSLRVASFKFQNLQAPSRQKVKNHRFLPAKTKKQDSIIKTGYINILDATPSRSEFRMPQDLLITDPIMRTIPVSVGKSMDFANKKSNYVGNITLPYQNNLDPFFQSGFGKGVIIAGCLTLAGLAAYAIASDDREKLRLELPDFSELIGKK